MIPDAALVAWLGHEEALFRRLERRIVAARIEDRVPRTAGEQPTWTVSCGSPWASRTGESRAWASRWNIT